MPKFCIVSDGEWSPAEVITKKKATGGAVDGMTWAKSEKQSQRGILHSEQSNWNP